MSENIITLKDVTMRFNLSKEKVETIKEYTVRLLTGRLHFDEFYALNDINLEVKKGEAVGLIGVNGCGKSTLLKLISGIYYPTKGKVEVHGTIAPLIELGAGFDMELTARENIYLNGAVLGYDKDFMDQHFDDIVDFAELREFLDVPVKNFSSGMTARLGFAIATMVSADILIVDEILAVGDVAFQKKCSERMAKMLENGTTLILVSHNIDDVKRLCNKVVYIKDHHVYNIGDSETVCNQYLQDMGVM